MNNAAQVLVTGANGFIGSACVDEFSKYFPVKSLSRGEVRLQKNVSHYALALQEHESIYNVLNGVDVIIHTIGVAHEVSNKSDLDYYREVNTVLTLNLAKQAAEAGVKRFIYVSSVNVGNLASDQNSYSDKYSVDFNALTMKLKKA